LKNKIKVIILEALVMMMMMMMMMMMTMMMTANSGRITGVKAKCMQLNGFNEHTFQYIV
jgi:hypothetical protein